MQTNRITRLRPRIPPPRSYEGAANQDADDEEGDDEDEGDVEEISDDDDTHYNDEGLASQKSKGKEKSTNRENFFDARSMQPLIYDAVKRAIAECGLPTPGPSPQKKTYTKSKVKQEVELEAKALSKDAKNAISVSVGWYGWRTKSGLILFQS